MATLFRLVIVTLLVLSTSVYAQNGSSGRSPEAQEFRSLDEQVQGLKEEVIKINREMLLLQEKLLYPSSSQVSVFVSLKSSPKFSLDSIELKLDDRPVQKHIYTFRELEALRNRGVHRLHTGNLTTGKHKLAVTVRGRTSGNSAYTRSASFNLKKTTGPKLVELKVLSSGGAKPTIKLKEW
jgi:hypothetical protein